jgi:hypothetical protein
MQVNIPLSHLAAALEFSAVNDVRCYLNGVYVDPRAGNLVATNSHAAYIGRPGSVTLDCEGDGFIISNAHCAEIIKAGKAIKAIAVTLDVVADMITVACLRVAPFKALEGQFPDWRRAYPADLSGEAASYNPEYLMRGVKAGKALGVKNPEYAFEFIQNGTGCAVMILAGGEAHVAVMPLRDPSTPATFERFGV